MTLHIAYHDSRVTRSAFSQEKKIKTLCHIWANMVSYEFKNPQLCCFWHQTKPGWFKPTRQPTDWKTHMQIISGNVLHSQSTALQNNSNQKESVHVIYLLLRFTSSFHISLFFFFLKKRLTTLWCLQISIHNECKQLHMSHSSETSSDV